MANANKLIPFILRWEGGFSNDGDDLGKQTNKGVTIATFRLFYGREKSVEDLKNITSSQWNQIFKVGYWDKWKADLINSQSIANMLVDWIWISGGISIYRTQKLLGLTADGMVGSKTISKLNSIPPKELFDIIKEDRLAYIDEICRKRPKNLKFRRGWLNRLNSIKFEG